MRGGGWCVPLEFLVVELDDWLVDVKGLGYFACYGVGVSPLEFLEVDLDHGLVGDE